jgi:hypothetical protein
MKTLNTLYAAGIAAVALVSSSYAVRAESLDFFAPNGGGPDSTYIVLYSGVDIVEDAHFFYSGGIMALNKDISRNGFLLQGFLGTGDYEYDSSSVPGGEVDADLTMLRGMVGYQWFTPGIRVAGYVGVDWQDNDLNPKDPENPVEGSETGFLVSGEFETVESKPFYLGAIGQYSTAHDTYWSQARVGWRFGNFVVGPEGIFMGNITYDAQRAGAFVSVPLNLARDVYFEVTLSGGYQWISDDDDGQDFGGIGGTSDGAYGNIGFSTAF